MKRQILRSALIASAFFFGSENIALSQSCNQKKINDPTADRIKVRARVDDVDAPLDGGLGLLIVAGIAYGIKRAHDRRKKIKEAGNTSDNIY